MAVSICSETQPQSFNQELLAMQRALMGNSELQVYLV